MAAKRLLLSVYDLKTKQVVCETTTNIKDGLMQDKHAIDLTACPPLTGYKYQVTVTDPDRNSRGLLYNSIQVSQGDFMPLEHITIRRLGPKHKWEIVDWSKTIYVLFNKNPKISDTPDNVSCDEEASPLVVDTTDSFESRGVLPLTSPADGVNFDILGERSFPVPHAKKRISWFKDPRYMWIVYPDRNGQVNGINEMFGNNTRGPDGKFAANGYQALAKFDRNRDRIIDEKDAVFKKLRLWGDANADGVAQPNELHTFTELGLVEIKLRYERKFSEEDQYGNVTRYRSEVRYKNGGTHKTYDVWFTIP